MVNTTSMLYRSQLKFLFGGLGGGEGKGDLGEHMTLHYLVNIVGIICGFQLLVCSPDMYELIVMDDLSAMVGIEG